MDNKEREQFWEILCSLAGTDKINDGKLLRNAIRYPKYLYRYRSVTNNSLEALRTNKLYFSSANYYDDPFDTFLNIDIEQLKAEYLNAFQSIESATAVVDGIKSLFRLKMTKEQEEQLTVENVLNALNQGLTESFLNSALALRDDVKKDIWSVCFSENGFNEVLWLKYANQHKGFIQFYDLENDEDFLCGKQAKCKECGVQLYGTPLYPIYYSNEPYNATGFAKIVILRKVEEILGRKLPDELYNGIKMDVWEQEKITLIKKMCHQYDEEWRMIVGCRMNPPIMREWRPCGVILGLRMEEMDENNVISTAKEAGIRNIYKSFINAKNELDARLIYQQ